MVHPSTRNQARSAVPDEIPHLYHFFYSAIEAVWVALVNFGFNNNNVNLFATGQSHLIDTAPLDRLLATTAINVASIDAFGTGSNVPQPRLYFNSHLPRRRNVTNSWRNWDSTFPPQATGVQNVSNLT